MIVPEKIGIAKIGVEHQNIIGRNGLPAEEPRRDHGVPGNQSLPSLPRPLVTDASDDQTCLPVT